MYGREYFHESVVKDIIDIVSSLKDYDEVQFISNTNAKRSFKSITSATKDLILTFPILVSTDIDPETTLMIAKAQEKKMASLLHILFTAICIDSNEDVYDYVQKFHSNIGSLDGTLDSYADAFDKLASTYENYDQILKIDKKVIKTVLEELKESNYTLPENTKEYSLESFKIIPGYRTGMNDMIIKEAKYNGDKNTYKGNSKHIDRSQTVSTGYGAKNSKFTQNYNMTDARVSIKNGTRTDDMKSLSQITNFEYDRHNKAVLNAEYKKANELQPTLMVVNFITKNDNDTNGIRSSQTAVIGVKAKIYPVQSTDICNRITGKLEDKNLLTNFVRATTNEIGFFRDFLLAIDKAKVDASSYGKKATSNKLWKVLERRSTKSKFRRSLKMYNDATAITTLVISENDVDYMKKQNGVDIMNISQARKLLDSYNLMCICIANESSEVANFLYDTGDDNYEAISYTGLEREASDNSYKKMVNLLTRVSR